MAAFEWNEQKAESNLKKHGVSFAEGRSVFGDGNALTYFDSQHSNAEDRFVTVGFSSSGILMVVVHTERGETTRLISARRATKREGNYYAQK